MGFESVRDAIEKRFETNWTTTPIKWENVPFKQPARTAATPAWVTLSIRGNQAGGLASIGAASSKLRRFPYTIINQIFVPEDTGTTLGYQYADSIGAIWRDASFTAGATGVIRCFEPNVLEIGTDDAGWYQFNVITNFQRDERI